MERIKKRPYRAHARRWRLFPRNSLTRRWITHVFAVILAFLLVLQVLFTAMLHYYYYQSVESALDSRAQLYQRTMEMTSLAETANWTTGSRELIAYFTDKDKMELQVLDNSGNVLLSSTGFVPSDDRKPSDFTLALSQESGEGVWRGRNAAGEKVMAKTVLQADQNGTVVGALRYVVSLSLVDRQVWLLSLLLFGFILLIVFFMSLSSLYFVNSIVNPVAAVSHTARRIAMGEYDVRLDKHYDDEIGRLCDSINFMAGEIGTAEQMKNEFISSVSHELRTPLTAIKGWSETMQAAPEDRELVSQGLAVIGKEATRLSGLVEELLDFSRMESGRITLRLGRLSVSAELEEAVLLFRDRAARAGIRLEYCPCENLPPVTGDADRIKQVLVNILDNAVKYSRAGDRIRVEAAALPNAVQIVISDTGIGIDEDKLAKVTQKFYQTDSNNPGSGIGLAVADEIVRLHNGQMEIDSEPNVGTAVTVLLPTEERNG
ncbi:MAG: HAMP domain-containing histidine kinase [Clostridia bacterium]|nr:HAMP domain-containing histidine kinase [Clostridia bacterium]